MLKALVAVWITRDDESSLLFMKYIKSIPTFQCRFTDNKSLLPMALFYFQIPPGLLYIFFKLRPETDRLDVVPLISPYSNSLSYFVLSFCFVS